MVKGKRQSERKSNSSLIRDLDAAIALLCRARALASSNDTSSKAVKPTSTGKTAKRTLSTEAREAIAAAQPEALGKSQATEEAGATLCGSKVGIPVATPVYSRRR